MKPDRKKGEAKPKRELHPPVRSGAEDPEPATGPGRIARGSLHHFHRRSISVDGLPGQPRWRF
jgi:hypothetical protein